jgi:alkanesulfonate monooxygenase SsuD/methylene tetrahydromethanopterin reductase-like flavin-dependent oxidoreductase (luciferase family)
MKVGAILMSQNSAEFTAAGGVEHGTHDASSQFFRDEIQSGVLAVSLGFDGIWNVEHHFTAHGETPAPLQQLTYFAGRTPGADLGTCVVVLPWNDPVRVAEQIAILDNLMSPGTELTIGLGRGSAQREFAGFDVPLGESSERFRENWEIVRLLLTQENVSYQGKWRHFTNLTTLPRPRSSDIVDRFHYSWASMTSMKFAAEEGFAPLFVAKGSAEANATDMVRFNEIRAELGWEPVRPIVSLNVFVDENADRAQEEGRKYLRAFYSNTLDHYQRLEPDHFKKAGNYAETARIAEEMASRDRDELLEELCSLQIVGTPDEVLEQLRRWREAMTPAQFLFSMRFGGMPYAETVRNMTAISGLLPEIHSWELAPLRWIDATVS